MIFDEENNKMVTVDEYFGSIDSGQHLRYYKCTNIETVSKEVEYKNCVVNVPAIDLSTPEDRLDNLAAISWALESIVGEVDSFRYEEVL